jgi:hypothetical protein
MVSLFPRGHFMSKQSGDSYSYRVEYTVKLHYPVGFYNENEFIYMPTFE